MVEAPPGFEPGVEVLQFGPLLAVPSKSVVLLRILKRPWCRMVPNEAQWCRSYYG